MRLLVARVQRDRVAAGRGSDRELDVRLCTPA